MAALVTAGTVLTLQTDWDGRVAQEASRERSRLDRHAAAIDFRLQDILTDLRLLASSGHLTGDLRGLPPVDIQGLQAELSAFVAAKNIYDQARYLDAGGMERIRVDRAGEGKARVVPDSQLQNKSERYYFSDAVKLKPGQIYISPFDLNIERGQIEVPFKPMIRLATPLFTSAGDLSGVAVLNYLGQDLLQRLDEVADTQSPPIQLLNRDGHWLKAPDPQWEWGFMFQRSDSFATVHPGVWRAAQQSPSGQWEADGRLWTWKRIEFLPEDARSSPGTSQAQGPSEEARQAQDYHWFAVSAIDASLSAAQSRELLIRYGALWLLSMGFVTWASVVIARRQSQLNQRNQELARATRELEFLAAHDPLTGVMNRRAFFASAEIESARAQRSSRPLAVIAADLDLFKRVNDEHGHHVGDRVLQDFCRRALGMLRSSDVMARFGGEEFVILLPETDAVGGQRMAERLRQEIATCRDTSLPDYTVSLGLAVWSGPSDQPIHIQALIDRADAALYRAKANGRNCVVLADEPG